MTDSERLVAIAETRDPHQLVGLISAYWGDRERADRTPREWLYFHLGLLSGTIERLLASPVRLAAVDPSDADPGTPSTRASSS